MRIFKALVFVVLFLFGIFCLMLVFHVEAQGQTPTPQPVEFTFNTPAAEQNVTSYRLYTAQTSTPNVQTSVSVAKPAMTAPITKVIVPNLTLPLYGNLTAINSFGEGAQSQRMLLGKPSPLTGSSAASPTTP